MLLLRSAFWLTVAFVVMKPHADVGAGIDSLSAQAFAAGQQMIAEQVRSPDCVSLDCQGRRAISAMFTSNPSSDSTMQDSNSTVPIPDRDRTGWDEAGCAFPRRQPARLQARCPVLAASFFVVSTA